MMDSFFLASANDPLRPAPQTLILRNLLINNMPKVCQTMAKPDHVVASLVMQINTLM